MTKAFQIGSIFTLMRTINVHNVHSRTINVHLSKEKELKCFQSKESLKDVCIAFLFCSSISDGVCLIHEGSNLPGRVSKCSTLLREFSTNDEFQYGVTRGEHGKSAYPMFGCRKCIGVKTERYKYTNTEICTKIWNTILPCTQRKSNATLIG